MKSAQLAVVSTVILHFLSFVFCYHTFGFVLIRGGGWVGVLPYKGLMVGTCGQPGYVFRDFCFKQGIDFIIFCLNQGIDFINFCLKRGIFSWTINSLCVCSTN